MPRTAKDPHGGVQKARQSVASHAAERTRTEAKHAEGRAQHAEGRAEHAEGRAQHAEAKAHASEHKRPDGIGVLGQAFDAAGVPVEEVAKGFGSLSRDLMSAASQAFEQSSQIIQGLMQARTVHDVVRVQIDLTSCLMDAHLRYVEAIGRAATQIGATSGHKEPARQRPPHTTATHTAAAKH